MPRQKRYKTSYPGVYYIDGTSVSTGKPERIYYVYYRRDGKQIEEKAGRQYQDDMTPAKAARIRAQRIEGNVPSNRERRIEATTSLQEQWTLNRIYEAFIEHKSHLKSLKDDRIRYNRHLKASLGRNTIAEITPFDVDAIRTALMKTHKPATVKQVLVLLKRIVNFGVSMGLCPSLAFKVVMPKVNNQRTEDLTPEQLTRLLQAIDDEPNVTAANIMKMALYTGMRRGELYNLQWDDIDYERRFITIRDPKGGTDQRIPINASAMQILGSQPRTESLYVFPGKGGQRMKDFRVAINRIKQRAGLPNDFRPLHGLRHVYASTLASSGQVDMYTLQKLLTHKSPQMTQRYAHLRDDALKRASNLAGELIQQAAKQAGADSEAQSA